MRLWFTMLAVMMLAACSGYRNANEVARLEAWRSISENPQARGMISQCVGDRFPAAPNELNEVQFSRNEQSDYVVARYRVDGDDDKYALIVTEFYLEGIPFISMGVGSGGGVGVACCQSGADNADGILCEGAQ